MKSSFPAAIWHSENMIISSIDPEWIILTVLGFILCTVMLELLAAAIAALSSF